MQKRAETVEVRMAIVTSEIIGAVGELRTIVASLDGKDRAYLEMELDRLQATVHRIAAFGDEINATEN